MDFPSALVIIVGIAVIALIFALLSTLLGLSVVWLRWFTLSEVQHADGEHIEFIKTQMGRVEARTLRYRLAWLLSMISLIFVSSLLLLRIFILLWGV
jgi:hypothetical protein